MNFNPEAVASWHGNSKTLPKRRFRPRVGLCRTLPGARSRRRPTAQPRLARGVRWTEVDRAHRLLEWPYMPHELPPWEAVYQQTQRWLHAGVFEEMVHDLRVLLRLSEGRALDPTPTILDSRTLQSTPDRAALGAATTGRSARRVRRYTRRWTHWDTCSPCM
jgi:transposase